MAVAAPGVAAFAGRAETLVECKAFPVALDVVEVKLIFVTQIVSGGRSPLKRAGIKMEVEPE